MTVLAAVRLAVRAGLSILPVAGDGSKRPAVPTWREFQTRRPSPAELTAFAFETHEGYGMIAGASSGCEAWDFDCAETYAAYLAAADACGLAEVLERIRGGYEDRTPGGGRRWIVRLPAGAVFADTTLARRPGRSGESSIKTLIELPTFAILAPSNGATHPSGRPYVRISGDFEMIASYTAEERAALVSLARSFDAMPAKASYTSQSRAQTAADDRRPGDAYNARSSWPELLEPRGWAAVYEREGVTYWRRPGKVFGISATTNHAGSDLLWVFSSSTAFEPDRSYDRFGAYAVLEHGGDFERAARAIVSTSKRSRSRTEGKRGDRIGVETPASHVVTAAPVWNWLADVERQQVDWLWAKRLAFGCLTIGIGDSGLGKSRMANDLAARVTTGAPWPDGGAPEVGAVVILSAEDSAAYTIRPAIELAGGDVSRVAVLEAVHDADGNDRTFRLFTDLPALEHLVTVTRARLVIIDPVSAYFGTALDSYRDTDVRAVLEPLVKLAERHQVAVLGIMHVGKNSERQARHRVLGSVAFVNAARLVFGIGPDPQAPERRLLVAVKANICQEAPALAFRLEDAGGLARVVWDAAPVGAVTADDVLSPRPDVDDERRDADTLLRELLESEDWPLSAKAIEAAGRAHGLHVRSLQRAAARLGIAIRHEPGYQGRWYWHRPKDDTPADPAPGTPAPASVCPAEAAKRAKDDKGVNVYLVSSLDDVSSMSDTGHPKTTVSSLSSLEKVQQNHQTPKDDNHDSTRAREAQGVLEASGPAEVLPAWVTDDMTPDYSDPIGEHDIEAPDDPWANLERPPGSLEAAAAVDARREAGDFARRRAKAHAPPARRGRSRPASGRRQAEIDLDRFAAAMLAEANRREEDGEA